MERMNFGGVDENLRKGLEATDQVSVEKLEAGLKEEQEQVQSAEERPEAIHEASDRELRSAVDIVMGKYKAEMPLEEARGKQLSKFWVKESKGNEISRQKAESQAPEEIRQRLGSSETVTYDDIMKRRAEEAAEVEQKVGAEKQKEGVVEEAVGKGAEGEKLRKELDEARMALVLVEKNNPKYSEAQKDYQVKKNAMQNVAYEAKRATLLKKGISEVNVEKELDKYTREVLAPNFTVAEAAKIQALRSEANPSLLEKMKDNKFSKLAYGAVDAYRKANWKKKIALSVGLLGVGVAAGATGGTVGLALAGIVTGGKGIQRFLSGAGTAVATEVWIQSSQQKWMAKEGWGKSRHEFIAKQIAALRESAKKSDVLSETEVEKSLSEREKMEKSNEINRAILAGLTGTLVGSGAAWEAVKQAGEWSGLSKVLGQTKDYWFGNKAEAPITQKEIPWKDTGGARGSSGVIAEKTMPIAELHKKSISLEIGARGPEGALIDEFKKNPELAKKFFGGEVTTEKLGAKVHLLWEAQAKQALANPETLAEMKKLGYPLNEEGYAKMAHRIGKGFLHIDPTGKNIKFADMEYLKNATKELKTLVDQPTPKEIPAFGVEEVLKKGDYHFEGHDKLKFPDFDLAEANRIIDADTLQKMMEAPGGKLGGLLSKIPSTDHKNLISLVSKTGGWNKFMDMPVSSLFHEDGIGVTDIGFTKLGYALKEVTGDAPMLHGTATIREVLDSIKAKEIFGKAAKEIMEKIK